MSLYRSIAAMSLKPSCAPLCCCYRKRQISLTEEKPKTTPLPIFKIFVISTSVFVSMFGSMVIFPFLPFMVHDFFPELPREELGQMAGYLGSAYFIGNLVSSLLWGWASDIWGRRPVILVNILGTLLSILLFGFSQNFAWAVSSRVLWGFADGIAGVTKSSLAEICDNTNQAKGFTVIGIVSGVGRTMGSVVGGFLSQPADKYSVFQVPFFCRFPYIVPCFVGAAIALISLICSWLFLDETLHLHKHKVRLHQENNGSSGGQPTDEVIELTPQSHPGSSKSSDNVTPSVNEETDIDPVVEQEVTHTDIELLIENDDAQFKSGVLGRMLSKVQELFWSLVHTVVHRLKEMVQWFQSLGRCLCCRGLGLYTVHAQGGLKSMTLRKLEAGQKKMKSMLVLMKDRRVVLSVVLYALAGFVAIVTNEVFPLMMVTGQEYGGYDMDGSEIGTVLMTVAVLQVVCMLVIYPPVAKCCGYRGSFQIALIALAAGSVFLPFSSSITGPVPTVKNISDTALGSGDFMNHSAPHYDNNVTFEANGTSSFCEGFQKTDLVNDNSVKRVPLYIWVTLIFGFGLIVLSRVSALTSAMVLVGNSSVPETRGSVNGFGQTTVAVARTLGPLAGALAFAWSTGNGKGWPLNFHFVLDLCAVVALITAGMTFLLPKNIEKKRETVDDP